MNKLMMTAVVAAMAATSFADVSSANTVGYMGKTFTKKYPSFGGMFLSVGSQDGKWCLKDWKIEGCDPSSDVLQVLNPQNAFTDYSVTYLDAEWASMILGDASLAGWWKADLSAPMDNVPFAAEQSFLASFASQIKLTYSGQVISSSEPKIDCTGLKYPMICNILPRRIQWKDLKVSGMDPSADSLQVLNPENAVTDYAVTYLNAEWALMILGDASLAGWWKADLSAPMNDEYIEPGDAFLASFANNIVITFPAAM